MGEFGRTPNINGTDGRDHYPQAWSAWLAGGGVRKGTVVGKTDERGAKVVAGEVTVDGYVDVASIVRQTINEVGYTDTELGFDGSTCGVMVAIQEQSPDIAVGVDSGGAGDQGMMFGMATRETPELMPLTLSIAHALTRQAAKVRRAHPNGRREEKADIGSRGGR